MNLKRVSWPLAILGLLLAAAVTLHPRSVDRASVRSPQSIQVQTNALSFPGLTPQADTRPPNVNADSHRQTWSQAFDPWHSADKRLARGTTHEVTVQNVMDYGYFCEFDDGLVGLVHKKDFGGLRAGIGDRVQVSIMWVDSVQRKIGLKLRAVIEEDVGDRVAGAHQHQLGL